MLRVVIVGGSDAGISAALGAREVDRTAEVVVVVGDAFPNYSVCGLPFYLSGEVAKRIDAVATALFHGMTVQALNDLDLSYTPTHSSPWDPVQQSAQAWAGGTAPA